MRAQTTSEGSSKPLYSDPSLPGVFSYGCECVCKHQSVSGLIFEGQEDAGTGQAPVLQSRVTRMPLHPHLTPQKKQKKKEEEDAKAKKKDEDDDEDEDDKKEAKQGFSLARCVSSDSGLRSWHPEARTRRPAAVVYTFPLPLRVEGWGRSRRVFVSC